MVTGVQPVLEILVHWKKISNQIIKNDLNVCSVISGNRNFEGRIHPLIKSNYLASPPLVVIYALAGRVDINFFKDEISNVNGKKCFLKIFGQV